MIEMTLTIVQADISSSSSKSFFSSEPTEGVHTVIEIYVDDRFTQLDRTLDESAAVVRRPVADRKRSTVDPLCITSYISMHHSGLYRDSRRQPGVYFVP